MLPTPVLHGALDADNAPRSSVFTGLLGTAFVTPLVPKPAVLALWLEQFAGELPELRVPDLLGMLACKPALVFIVATADVLKPPRPDEEPRCDASCTAALLAAKVLPPMRPTVLALGLELLAAELPGLGVFALPGLLACEPALGLAAATAEVFKPPSPDEEPRWEVSSAADLLAAKVLPPMRPPVLAARAGLVRSRACTEMSYHLSETSVLAC